MIHTVFFGFLTTIFALALLNYSYKRFYRSAYPTHYSSFVSTYSEQAGVDPALVYAVIRSESGFEHDAVSSVGAKGLMQITLDTYEWAQTRKRVDEIMAHDTLYDPETNIEFGSYILSLLLDEFQNIPTALAAYHAGWGNVKSWLADEAYSSDGVTLDVIPFTDTNLYVQKVLETIEIYQQLYTL